MLEWMNFIKVFTANRTPYAGDVLLDTAGALLAGILLVFFSETGQKIIVVTKIFKRVQEITGYDVFDNIIKQLCYDFLDKEKGMEKAVSIWQSKSVINVYWRN